MATYISFQPSDYFSTKLYTGTGASNAVTSVGFQPDITWLKDYDGTAYNHIIIDAVRGATKNIYPNGTWAEDTLVEGLKSFDANGFTVGTDNSYNKSGDEFVSWNWKAGTTSGLSGGTITPSAYSINTTNGFGIYKYVGNGTSGATIAHGLGTAPGFMIIKQLSAPTQPWQGFFNATNGGDSPEDFSKELDTSGSKQNNSGAWNDTAPSATLITLGNAGELNSTSEDYIAYVWAPVRGFSHMSNYRGSSNSQGPFAYCGFRPGFIIIKSDAGSTDWGIWDTKRPGNAKGNGYNTQLKPNLDVNAATDEVMDITSTGFKIRQTNTYINASGAVFTYAAFAQFPVVSSNDIPGVAR